MTDGESVTMNKHPVQLRQLGPSSPWTITSPSQFSKERKWHRGIVTHLRSESQWNRSHFSVNSCILRSAKSGELFQQSGFRDHVAADGFPWALQESGEHVVGQLRRCFLMEKWDFCMEMYGTMDPELEVQGTKQEGQS